MQKEMLKKRIWIFIPTITFVLTFFILYIFYRVFFTLHPTQEDKDKAQNITMQAAIQAGKDLSHQHCTGTGSVVLGTSPMKPEDFSFLIPYGMTVSNHVTPIDHQYFTPTNFNSLPNTYPVYAMADGIIVDIQTRGEEPYTASSNYLFDYRLVFAHTCTFLTYYDLLTTLASELQTEFDRVQSNGYSGAMSYSIKEGELVGYIGGQTLDFAVWDTTKPLDGFINPDSYISEPWKIYTANPYDYYSEDLKTLLTEKNLRTADPIQGKIDYDIDGKIVGNWFVENTNGYAGTTNSLYYSKTHLAIIYDHLDPDAIIFSIGNYNGTPMQFTVFENLPDPATVSTETGLIKYRLTGWDYIKTDGQRWDRDSLAKNLKLVPSEDIQACVLLQLEEFRKLKVEVFPEEDCANIPDFTSGATYYVR